MLLKITWYLLASSKQTIKEEEMADFTVVGWDNDDVEITLTINKKLKKIVYKRFDIVVIGGGVTGAGIALDALWGFKTPLTVWSVFKWDCLSRQLKRSLFCIP